MRNSLNSMKKTLLVMVLLIAGSYFIYASDWFQKKYVYPLPYQAIIYRYALQYQVDPSLIAGVIRTESKFLPQARSPKGAVGLMQMMPETAQWVASQLDCTNFCLGDLEDPETSIRFGTWYLSSLRREFKDNRILILAAYNGGRGNVRQWMRQYGWENSFGDIEQIPFRETREYVGKVLHAEERYQQLYHD